MWSGNPPLRKLVLRCRFYQAPSPINILLSAAIEQQLAVEVDLSVEPNRATWVFSLPALVFTSPWLKRLKLKGVKVTVPDDVFPNLMSLHIDISLDSDDSLQDIYRKLPNLQDLTLEGNSSGRCTFSNKRWFKVYSTTLKTLRITIKSDNELAERGVHASQPGYVFEIMTPQLEELLITDNKWASYNIIECSAIKATIEVGYNNWGLYELSHPDSLNDVFKIIRGLTKVRTLTLLKNTTAAADFNLQKYMITGVSAGGIHQKHTIGALDSLSGVTHLSLQVADHYGLRFLMYLLKNTIGLQSLHIEMESPLSRLESPDLDFWERESSSDCTLDKLKVVKMTDISGLPHEMGIVKFLLKKSPVLEVMSIMPCVSVTMEARSIILTGLLSDALVS